jgi:hypothetical protein
MGCLLYALVALALVGYVVGSIWESASPQGQHILIGVPLALAILWVAKANQKL